MGKHREIPVRVNAWVNEGIAPLVEALSEFENVWGRQLRGRPG